MNESTRMNRRIVQLLSCGSLIAGVVVAWLVLYGGATSPAAKGPLAHLATPTGSALHRLTPATTDPPEADATTRRIEELRVGDRVLAQNPQVGAAERASFADPDPSSWQRLELVMDKTDGSQLEVSLLRPTPWLLARNATVGGRISLDLPRLNTYGVARVLAIEESPRIQSGAGSVVVGTFRHTSDEILDLRLGGLEEPIGVTAGHPIWSEDREEFVEADKLRVGEEVRTAAGQSTCISSISPRGPPAPVYNIEVHGEHVYYVSRLGILVHNDCERDELIRAAKGGYDEAFAMRDKFPHRTLEEFDRMGFLPAEDFRFYSKLTRSRGGVILVTGSSTETPHGLRTRYTPGGLKGSPLFRQQKPYSNLLESGKGDVDIWEGSRLTDSELAEIAKHFGIDAGEIDLYTYQYGYRSVESFREKGVGGIVFTPEGSFRIRARWQQQQND